MVFTNNFQLDLLAIATSIVVILIAWQKWIFGYWKRKGVVYPEPTLVIGNLKEFFLGTKQVGIVLKDMYHEYKSKGSRYFGCYFAINPAYFPVDLDLVKAVFQDDFTSFHSHGAYNNEHADPLSTNLFNLDGQRWREIRTKVTPTFTTGKIKTIHKILSVCSGHLKDNLDGYADKKPVEIKDVMARFLTDVIGSAVFGVDINCLENPDAEFRYYGDKVAAPSIGNALRFTAPLFIPHAFLRMINFKTQAKDVVDFFTDSVKSTIKYREDNNVVRQDFMNMMIRMKNSKDETERMSMSEIIAQSFVFFAAGFETSSTTIHYAAYELAVNPDIQEKVREEIDRVLKKYDGEVTYDALMEMDYLEMVIKETLRKYPPLNFMFRKCTKTYTIPGENVQIDKGTVVILSILGIHYDEQYYPNAEKFDPERFTKENIQSRPAFTWIPFGEGPRICVGQRFGMYQSKMGLTTLIRNYKISLNEKTISPLVISPSAFLHTCVGGIWLDLKKVSPGK